MKYLLYNLLSIFLTYYERWIMYRLREIWGISNLKKIKNKGNNCKIIGYSRILDPEKIVLGDNIRIGYGCFLFGKGGIVIGDNSILSRNITIYSSNHDFKSEDFIPYNNNYINKPVVIGNGVWIGMGVMITPGVSIGDGAIIGMGCVISKNVLPGEIVVGAGQRTVANRDMIKFYKNVSSGNIFSLNFKD